MEDIESVIQRKIWTAEQLLLRAKEIVEKSKSLSPSIRKGISVTISDWSEDKVRKHIEAIREAVIYPIRHENKKKLESIGVDIEKIPEGIFDDTKLIDNIVAHFEDIKDISNQLADILIGERLIEGWLKESPDEIKQKLNDIVNAKSSFKDVLEKKIDQKFKYELLKRALENIEYLEDVNEILSDIEYVSSFGVLLDYSTPFKEFCENLDKARRKIEDILESYGISEDKIRQKINKKILSDACKDLEQLENECAERKRTLLDEWKLYASTLKSFGEEITEPPNILPELEKFVSSMKEKCLKHLGESGFRLLKFLRGEEEFPDDIEIKEIKKALEALRPIFLKSLREEG